MKGAYEVKVSRRRGTKYSFNIRRNITIIRGDSATGKTTLFDMVADHTRLGDASGVSIQCNRPCVALTDFDWKNQLEGFRNSIVFIDEGLKDLLSDDFARSVRGSSNYFVIISRADIPSLPYSVDEVYGIKTSGKYHSLVPLYVDRGNHRYSLSRSAPKTDFDLLLTEDSKSGFQFFETRFSGTNVSCESAKSNANILKWLDAHKDQHIFVIADGAAFGAFADRVLKLQDARRDHISICLPESFEWLLLESGAVESDAITAALRDPASHIDSADFMSWERYFTDLAVRETAGSPAEYKKSQINDFYCSDGNAAKIMALIACRNIR